MPANDNRKFSAILVASRDMSLTERISNVLDESFSITVTTNTSGIPGLAGRSSPLLLMLDSSLFDNTLQATITETIHLAPQTRVIVVENENSKPVDQLALFKSGAHGFVAQTISPALLLKAAHAVCNGEIWVPRKLITELIGELARDTSTGSHTLSFAGNSSIEHLTPRELQVAQMVHRGGNNKSIARTLDISERTVKAHLSAIFRKLDIENRLHLALFFSELK
jgi:DNA-binding NarL/FixJ family response regulator